MDTLKSIADSLKEELGITDEEILDNLKDNLVNLPSTATNTASGFKKMSTKAFSSFIEHGINADKITVRADIEVDGNTYSAVYERDIKPPKYVVIGTETYLKRDGLINVTSEDYRRLVKRGEGWL